MEKQVKIRKEVIYSETLKTPKGIRPKIDEIEKFLDQGFEYNSYIHNELNEWIKLKSLKFREEVKKSYKCSSLPDCSIYYSDRSGRTYPESVTLICTFVTT